MRKYTAIYVDECGFRTAIPVEAENINIREACNLLEEYGYDIDNIIKIVEGDDDD